MVSISIHHVRGRDLPSTRPIDELTRRRHRRAVEAYLKWCENDGGPTTGRHRRFEQQSLHDHQELMRSREGLDQFAHYRELVVRTLPIDHH